jgi:site-specific DNA recombinase
MLDNLNTNSEDGKVLRCAIYTRKSHEEGLDQEFNSLDAQRESGEAYIESQRMQGWQVIPTLYDDGGFSGGTMERPGLQKLLADIDAGKVDVIVVYKIDRLSRSLLDFMHMIETFNAQGVSFVSVTQHFSTTDSTGRMFLGILITFAQYEREVAADRIRDKVAAAKRRGKYCGGVPVLGYDVDRQAKKLVINKEEAKLVKYIFQRFTQLGSAKTMATELNEQGYTTKTWLTKKGKIHQGKLWNTSHIYRLLKNRTYIGQVTHKDKYYPGEHQAIVAEKEWDKVQGVLADNTRDKIGDVRVKMISPLKGVIRCGHCDCAMGPTYTRKGERRYTYYICEKDTKRAISTCPIKRLPAGDIEKAVIEQLGAVFRTPTLVAKTYFTAREMEKTENDRLQKQKYQLEKELASIRKDALTLTSSSKEEPDKKEKLADLSQQVINKSRQLANVSNQCQLYEGKKITEQNVASTFQSVESFWEQLFPMERHRLIHLLVEKVELRETGIDMSLKTNGLTNLIAELSGLANLAHKRKELS